MNRQIYEEASDWLVKNREADLDAQEKRLFDTWLRQSPQHVRAYLEMSAIWEDVSALDPGLNVFAADLVGLARVQDNVVPLGLASAIEPGGQYQGPRDQPGFIVQPAANAQGKEPFGAAEMVAAAQPMSSSRLAWFAFAATVLLAVIVTAASYWLERNTYATDIGEQRSIVLNDGSTVELNSRSRVRVRFSDGQRDVDLLEGQAIFQVAHNAARPFIVHSGTTHVRAVGTQFDVYKKKTGTVVTVVEGKVAVASSALQLPENPDLPGMATPAPQAAGEAAAVPRQGQAESAVRRGQDGDDSPFAMQEAAMRGGAASGTAIVLIAGEQLTVPAAVPARSAGEAAAGISKRANVAAATAWTQRTLVFDSSPLTEVAEEFNRYNTRQLVIRDRELADIHISGVFSSVDSTLLLKFLHAQPEIKIEETDKEIRISKR